MKVFNKEIALRKIKLKQNKNTYIKKVSIVLSCFILLVGIMYFTFAKFEQNSEEYTLINGVVKYGGSGDITLSYVVDGVSQSTPPGKNDGYIIKNINCTNAIGIWDSVRWGLNVDDITGKVKCNLEFEEAQYNNVTKWLAIANIDKNYTTISEVLNDNDVLNTLISNEASCNYLDNSTEWINEVTSNENAMTYIGMDDYCGDKLYIDNNWIDSIINSSYYDKILQPLVPTMNNYTEPKGEVKASNDISSAPSWLAFDGYDTGYPHGWHTGNGSTSSVRWIQYMFDSDGFVPRRVEISFVKNEWNPQDHISKIDIQGSNNGTDFTSLYSYDPTNIMNTQFININNNIKYKYLRIEFTGYSHHKTEYGTYYAVAISEIQYYGRKNV